MNMQVTERRETQVARPLKVLTGLIKEQLRLAREAAAQAAQPYWYEAGNLLREAKSSEEMRQQGAGAFGRYCRANFKESLVQLQAWMAAASVTTTRDLQKQGSLVLEDMLRRYDDRKGTSYARGPVTSRTDWHDLVKKVIGGINYDALAQEQLKRAEERELQQKLALKLIDIGYKVLSRELHPDKPGGSREAMTRLNQVRDRLKQHA